jgi:hypothetical protein
MSTIQDSTEFRQSCLNYLFYPQNLIPELAETYPWTLEAYRARLDSLAKTLCLDDEKDVDMPIRDLHWIPGTGVGPFMLHFMTL